MNSMKYKIILLAFLVVFYGCSTSSSAKVIFNVLDPSTNMLENNTSEFIFPSVLKNSTISQTFTIKNDGRATLKLEGSPIVEVSGTNANAFTVIEQPESVVKPFDETTFKVQFAPVDSVSYDAILTFANNSKDSNPFEFKIKGVGLEPGLNVKQDTNYIPNGSGSYDFGNVRIGELSPEITFVIENSGANDLNLTGTPKISIAGSSVSMFTLNQSSVISPIAPMGTATFTIVFAPTSAGLKSITVTFANDDANKNPYTFTVTGTGANSEIDVKQGTTDIVSGTGTYDFGNVNAHTSSQEIQFTIENNGSDELNLTGNPKIEITGTDASLFTTNLVKTQSPVKPGGLTSFGLKFRPTDSGVKTATVTIENDDSDEDPYTFTVKGTCTAPEINVRQGAHDLLTGTGVYSFGTVGLQKVSEEITFTIENTGNKDLNLSGNPRVYISGTDSTMFTVNQSMTNALITPGNSTTFKVVFSPITLGWKTATISIANDDPDESPYKFEVKGTTTKFDHNGDDYEDVIVGAVYDDDGGNSSGCAFVFFGSANPTNPLDASAADVKYVGNNAGDCFGVSVCSAGDFNGDGFDDVIVGANKDDDGGTDSGCAFIFFGYSYLPTKLKASGAHVKLVGENASDYFGSTVSCAGDVNNDGFDDVIIGADNNNTTGRAYIFYGGPNPTQEIDASNADVILVGATTCKYFGNVVSNGGDINNDDFDDVIVTATQYDDGSKTVGCAFIFYGSSNLNSTINSADANVKLLGDDPNDCFAYSVSNAGDVNNDGFDDVIVGAYEDDDGGSNSGCAFIFYGSTSLAQKIYATSASIKIIGEDDGDNFGFSVSCAGDVNNDGFKDVIIGADSDDDGGMFSGCSFIFYGGSNLSSLKYASTADVQIVGEFAFDEFGYSVSSAGDFNGDGLDDIIIGATGASDGGSTSGNAYVFFGSYNLNQTIDASLAELKLIGEDSADSFGCSVSGGR